MAREYARVKVGIWRDLDFRSLSPDAQHLYFILLTAPTMNLAGVADWRPARLAALASGLTAAKVRKIGAELESAHYIIIDEETEEVLVRSFIRHDGILKGPKTAIGMMNAYSSISSMNIMRAVAREVARTAQREPELRGLDAVSELIAEGTAEVSDTPSDTPSQEYAASIPIQQPTTNNQQPTRTASLAVVADDDRFEEWWDAYDKKDGKKVARQKWNLALKKKGVTQDLLIEATHRYINHLKAKGKHPDYTKNPTTWLNGEHWNDEIPSTASPVMANGKPRVEGW